MPIRIATGAVLAILLAACGGGEPVDAAACCDIAPEQQCRSDLAERGATEYETELVLHANEDICPSTRLSETRIRQLVEVSADSKACRSATGYGRLRALEGGLCPVRSGFNAPFVPEGADPQFVAACATNLIGRGLAETEFNAVMRDPAAICPTAGVSGLRLREIVAKDWPAAGCTHLTQDQMLAALTAGRCGRDGS